MPTKNNIQSILSA